MTWIPGERLDHRPASIPTRQADDSRPLVGVLALQGDVLEHLRALERCDARTVRVRRIEHLEGLDGLIIPGGESTTIGKLLERFELLEPLRASLDNGLPVMGTCAGMILLSRRLDQDFDQPLLGVLDVTTRRNAFGTQVDSFERDLDITGIDGGPVRTAFIRAPWVESVGDGVEVLAEVDGHPVVVRQGSVLAIAFHPEVTGDDRLHRYFLERLVALGDRV